MIINIFSSITDIDLSALQAYLTPDSIYGLLKILLLLTTEYSKQKAPDAKPSNIGVGSPKRKRRKHKR